MNNLVSVAGNSFSLMGECLCPGYTKAALTRAGQIILWAVAPMACSVGFEICMGVIFVLQRRSFLPLLEWIGKNSSL